LHGPPQREETEPETKRVNTEVALPDLASGWAVRIGTKCGGEVHAPPPGVDVAFAKSRAGPSLLLRIRFTTL
jgi:hypothetical protein